MKKLFYVLMFFSGIVNSLQADHLQTIFDNLKVKTFLEFGLGEDTPRLLQQSRKVISVEIVTHGYGPARVQQCMSMYHDYSNWIPIVFFTGYQGDFSWAPYKYLGSESVYKATSYQSATHQSFEFIDDFYLAELNAFIRNLKKCHKIDAALVNGAIILRGDIVQLLFDKVPVIIGTSVSKEKGDLYGYSRLSVPENYETIFFSNGVTIWVSKDAEYRKLVNELKLVGGKSD